jgi:hypothetical protein
MIAKSTFSAATAAEGSSKKSQKSGQKRPRPEIFHTFYKIANLHQSCNGSQGIVRQNHRKQAPQSCCGKSHSIVATLLF